MPVRAGWEFVETRSSWLRRWVTPITASAALLALTTGFLWMIDASLQYDHVIFIYFVPTALIAIRYGSVPAMCVTIAAAFAAAFFFYEPRFSFKVENPLDLLELILFSLLALLASRVVSGFAGDSEVKERQQRAGTASSRPRWPLMVALWESLSR